MSPARSDEALARAAAQGDQLAFGELYQRYEQRLSTYCRRVTGRDEDAADAVQDAFVKLLRKLPERRDSIDNFSAFVFTVARNACYDLLRARKRVDPVDEVPEPAASMDSGDITTFMTDPERRALTESMRAEVAAASDRLPERHREVLVLREVEGLSYDEIAGVLGMKRNAVSQLILRARNGLGRELRRGTLAGLAEPSSPGCEHARQLITMRQDGEALDQPDAVFLDMHVASCAECTLTSEALAEIAITYRAWAPAALVGVGLQEAVFGAVSEAFAFGWVAGGAGAAAGGATTTASTAVVATAAKGGLIAKLAVVVAATAAVGGGAAVIAGGDEKPSTPAAVTAPANATPIVQTTPPPPVTTPATTTKPKAKPKKKAAKKKPRAKVVNSLTPAPTSAQPQAAPPAAPAPKPAPAPAPAAPQPEPSLDLEIEP